MVNYQEFIIPESDQGYYKYYKFEFNSNDTHTRFAELALFSLYPKSGLFAIPNCPNRTQLRSSFNNYKDFRDRGNHFISLVKAL